MSASKEDPEALALRAPPRPVTRLNRRTIAVTVGMLAALILGGTLWSLQKQQGGMPNAPTELHNTDRIAHADGLAQLPNDYSKVVRPAPVPKLGPPLPGDLGEALLRAERPLPPMPASVTPALQADPAAGEARAARLNRQREAEEAAKAPIFFRSSMRKETTDSAGEGGRLTSSTLTAAAELPVTRNEPTLTVRSSTSSNDATDGRPALGKRPTSSTAQQARTLQPPSSVYQVMAGTVIAAALITGINSDLPGQVLAAVTENVYDTATGRHLLIPQGSRLIGQYDSQVASGQRRVLLAWTRLVLPDASSIGLDRVPGVDVSGYAGLEDDVDRHWQQLLMGAALSTLIGIGAELAAPGVSNSVSGVVVVTREGIQDGVNQVGQELTRRNLNVPPTITIRPGFSVRVIVNRDLLLRPY